ncbi:MAG: type II secretion system major pseudopilin GspG [candidate division WS1 bacterium]|jgi:general secretion pathway protein G|nr:type II secretion system major pseudopilin GspG [candidate division WS1 bacterium]
MIRSNRRGLTPTETLLVAALVAAFALIVASRFVADPTHEARELTIVRVQTVMDALERYAIDNAGVFPTTDQGLNALVVKPQQPPLPIRWPGPYIDDPKMLEDAWGMPLQYVSPGAGNRPYVLWSNGADRAEKGEGEDADIQSWDRSTQIP